MHKAVKWAALLMVGGASGAWAQQTLGPANILLPALKVPNLGPTELPSYPANPQARTLGEHMESSNNNYAKFLEIYKNIKLSELALGVESNLQTPKTDAIIPKNKPIAAQPFKRKAVSQLKSAFVAPEPRIWYLSGLGDQITAELIYEKSVYRLNSSLVNQRIGPWVLIGMDNKGVVLQLSNSAKTAWLEAPRRGQDPKDFFDAVGLAPSSETDTSALQKSSAVALPNTGMANLSLPLVLPKP
jgi:hypothetical protein